MEFTAAEIAGLIKGKVIGDQGVKVHGFSPIEEGRHGHLSFMKNLHIFYTLRRVLCLLFQKIF